MQVSSVTHCSPSIPGKVPNVAAKLPKDIGDRGIGPDDKTYEIVGHGAMSYKTRWVNPRTNMVCGPVYSMALLSPDPHGSQPGSIEPTTKGA